MDFSAWFEVYLDGRWFTLDARHNHPRIGRIVMARGRDAADVAISTTFGAVQLMKFSVITDEGTSSRARSHGLPDREDFALKAVAGLEVASTAFLRA
jgi:transglutaminase-like putative cysteine protease